MKLGEQTVKLSGATSSERPPAAARSLRLLFGCLAAACAVLASVVVPAPVAGAALGPVADQATLGDGVSGLEIDRTTAIEAEVWAIESVGSIMLVGGAFLNVRDRSTYATTPWPYLAAFDPSTGEHIPWFNTRPDGPVFDIVDLGNGRALIAGEFSNVNGAPGTEKLAVIDTATGLVDSSYSFDFDSGDATVVRATAIHNDWLYVTGGFNRANGNGVAADTRGLARFSLATGQLDPSWTPELRGGGGFAIGVADTGRVFVGGYFSSVNNEPNTETFAALEPGTGELVAGWEHGFPHFKCAAAWRTTCGAINGLAVHGDRVFVAGAKHFWAAIDVADGTRLVVNELTNDGQGVDLVDGKIVIGCHCETSTFSNEFNGIAHRYIRVIDPITMTEIESPTVNSRGAAGGWAADSAADGCLWTGGNFSSTFVNGVQRPAWSLLRFCPAAGGQNPPLPQPDDSDTSAPATPLAPTIATVRGSTVDLQWSPTTDDSGQVAYLVYRNGTLVGRTSGSSYTDKLLAYSSTNEWQVAAVDMAGNQTPLSPRSQPVRIGARINIASQAVATQSSDFDASTTAGRAIDGLLSTDPAAQLPSRTGDLAVSTNPWIDLDLGQVTNVDSIELHPRRDDDFRESNNRTRVFYDTSPVTADNRADAAVGGHRVWIGDVSRTEATPRIDSVSTAESIRHIRIFGSLKRVSFDEIRIYTAQAEPTPAPTPLDTTDPTDPAWSRISTRGNQSVLEWGGATDGVGVAYYEIAGPDGSTWRTAATRLSVGAAGQIARDFQIVAVDAAGNKSSELLTPTSVADCSVTLAGDTVDVAWTAVDGSDRYIVRRSVDGGTQFWRGVTTAPGTSFSDSNRSGALVYSVEARFGGVATTPAVCAVAQGADVPTGLRITREEKRKVVLNFGGDGRPVEIERDGVIVDTHDGNWFVDSGLESGTTYSYRVRFADSEDWSDPVTALTAGGVALVAPATCAVTNDAAGFAVSWDTVPSADAYVVERSVDGGNWWWRGRITTSTFDDTPRSGTVEYRVRAISADGSTSENTFCL